MHTEKSYIAIFSAALLMTFGSFLFLFEKYSYATLYYVAQQCYLSLSSFFTSPFHLIGLSVFSIALSLSTLFLLKCLFSAWKTQQRMSEFAHHRLQTLPLYLIRLCHRHGISTSQVTLVKSTQPLAYAMGMFSQRIVLTTGLLKLLTKKELEAVLLHEKYHTLHRHGLVILCAEITASTLTFFPILHDTLARMKASFELAADQYAQDIQGTGRYVYAAIIAMTDPSQRSTTLPFTPAFGLTVIEERVHSLQHKALPAYLYSRGKLLCTLLSFLILFTLIFFPTQQYAAETARESLDGSSCVNTLQCSAQCQAAHISRTEKQTAAQFSGSSHASTAE